MRMWKTYDITSRWMLALVGVVGLICSPGSSFPLQDACRSLDLRSPAAVSSTQLRLSSFTAPIDNKWNGRRRKFKRKIIPKSEQEARRLRKERQKQYEKLVSKNNDVPSIWSFECLFPEPVLDLESVDRDLYAVQRRDKKKVLERKSLAGKAATRKYETTGNAFLQNMFGDPQIKPRNLPAFDPVANETTATAAMPSIASAETATQTTSTDATTATQVNATTTAFRVDRGMTRVVEDKMYGFRRGVSGDIQYDTSLMGDGAVKFRDGVRLGNALSINADRLNYMAKKEMRKNRVDEAKELYETAIEIDPRDGRAYLGLSRCAQRRRDFNLAREWLNLGIANAVSSANNMCPDRGANPFLLQALGCLEEKAGHLSKAEGLYVSAVRSRPSHAASWVSLGQLRVRKLGQSASAGRSCFQSAEREAKQVGTPLSAYVYTAWADLEHKVVKDAKTAKQLLKKALEIDPRCSAAWLHLGRIEAELMNWEKAEACFEKVLTFDKRNSRVLQAYAIMETQRPSGDSEKIVTLFEKALKANSRDAGVLQAYGMYVQGCGDFDKARTLLHLATETNKRHAPAWQALGVLETRLGNFEEARSVFQQGIWACAQMTGNNSGGHHCCRLWQAWGLLESKEGNPAAARRCFSRALDADGRNVATITAWALMEEELGNHADARSIFERALSRFSAGSEEKRSLWRSYELLETRTGTRESAQKVYQRSMREYMAIDDTSMLPKPVETATETTPVKTTKGKSSPSKETEVEVIRWKGGGEVIYNDNTLGR